MAPSRHDGTMAAARLPISIGCWRAHECSAEISVQDGGHGIASDVLAHLFEPFAQGEKTLERSAGGLGLGLALVKGLAELHDGTVSAHNPGPGHGARFVVRLPLERRLTTHLSVVETPPAPSTSRRVLVIEDDEIPVVAALGVDRDGASCRREDRIAVGRRDIETWMKAAIAREWVAAPAEC